MSPESPDRTCNVPVRVLGWDEGGRAKVEILATVNGLQIGQKAPAGPRPVAMGRQPLDFAALRKAGLRVGGVALLRKAVAEDDGRLSARSVETVVGRERDGLALVLHGAAACILPPPPGTKIASECLVALASEAVACRSPRKAVDEIKESLSRACQFGRGGLILTGEDRDGDALEVIVGGEAELRPDEVADLFVSAVPPDIAQQASRSKSPWWLVAFFRGELDPERSSKASAQRMNLDYGSGGEPLWNRTNAVLRAFVHSWLVCDVTPDVEVPGISTRLLLDILDGK